MELLFTDPPSREALEKAFRMGKDLLGSVYNLYDEWLGKDSHGGKGDGGGDGGGKGASRGGRKGQDNMEKIKEMEFQHSIEIAECDPGFSIRGKLLGARGKNVRDIEEKTGAILQLKGESGEVMRLEMGATTAEVLQEAQDQAEDLVAKVYSDYDEWMANGGKEGEAARKKEEDTENKRQGESRRGNKRKADKPVGGDFTESMELQECDPGFTLRGKILGSRGSRLRSLEEKTGARFQLVGNESETMRLEIAADSQEVLDAAVQAAEEFTQSVYDDYARWLEEDGGGGANGESTDGAPRSRGKGAGKQQQRRRQQDNDDGHRKGQGGGAKGGGRGQGSGDPAPMKKILKLKDCENDFDLRNRIKGNKCENLHHIQDATGSRLWVLGERDEPVRLEIAGDEKGSFDRAVQMSKDLIKSVFRDYDGWLKERGLPPQQGAKKARPS
uniref:K Homology domain-containing protein n=1 Tax=Zooxanthella nutricula TaxID=1333877 RepID=A0A7S2JBL1_9DINO